MSNRPNRMNQFQQYQECSELLDASGCGNDPVYRDLFLEMVASPLQKGATAAKATNIMNGILAPKVAANLRTGNPADRWPDFSKSDPYYVGRDIRTGEAISTPGQHFIRHCLDAGPSGSGKSTQIRRKISWFAKRRIPALYMDHKDDGRKLLNVFQSILIIAVTQIYENLVKPVGDAFTYYAMFCSELCKRYPLHPSTEGKLVEILCDMHAGLSEGRPHFSLKDVEETVKELARTRSDPTLKTAARELGAFNRSLGRAAYVREGPGVECGKWLIVVVECLGVNNDFLAVFSSIRLARFMLASREKGHSDKIQSAYISDEGQFEFGKQFQSRSGSKSVEAPERMFSQVRSLGKAIAAGVQHVAKIMDVATANIGSFMCFGVQTDDDARLSANLLGMRSREERDSLWNPPPYCAWFKCALNSQYRLVKLEDMPAGDVPSSTAVSQIMAPDIEWLESQCVFSPYRDNMRNPINYKVILGEEEPTTAVNDAGTTPPLIAELEEFLSAVKNSPDLSMRARYKDLGLSAGVGQRIRDALASQGLIEIVTQPSKGGRPEKRLRITEKGQEYLDGLS